MPTVIRMTSADRPSRGITPASACLPADRRSDCQGGQVSPHPNRRAALIAAGQGMTLLLLAACGKAVGQSAQSATSTSAPATRTTSPGGAQDQLQVTVPGLEQPPSSVSRTLIPLQPVTHPSTSPSARTHAPVSSTPTTAAGHTTTSDATTSSSATKVTRATKATESATPDPVTHTTATPTTTAQTTSSTKRVAGAGLSGRVVAIDPGHNGANAEHPEIINQLIDGGYGQRNACNTTGTETNAGYPEHEFTWNVANYLKPLLEARGITVVMTRSNDSSVGPCTNKRAAIENNADADAVVSIHGDGAAAGVRGFYVLTATRPPAGSVIAAESLRLAAAIASAAENEGFPPSNTLGHNGLWKRDDLTGLNLSMRPKILIECGNMRNATEAALMSSSSGQRRYAQALAQGVISFLQG